MAHIAAPQTRRFGAQSMTAPLHEVLVKRPGEAFGRAHDDPAHGFLHPVDLTAGPPPARCLLRRSSPASASTVHELGAETASPDLVYTFDPAAGHRPRRDPAALGQADPPGRGGGARGLGGRPTASRRSGGSRRPGTVDGGDTFWLRPDLFCIGRSLRTNAAGARQLAELVGGDVRVFDVPYANGPAECLHLLSVISPVGRRPGGRLPAPAARRPVRAPARALGVGLVPVPEEEFADPGLQRPGRAAGRGASMVDGQPGHAARAARGRGCEVHTFPGDEIGINGSAAPPASPARSCADEEPARRPSWPSSANGRPRPPGRRPGRARRDPRA